MGADFLLACVPVPQYEDGTDVKDVNTIMERFARLDSEVVLEALEESGEIYSLPEDEDGETPYGAVTERVRELVESLVPYGGRDTGTLMLGGKWYLFTGGMSWGDEPTESFDAVSLIGTLGLFEEPYPV